MKIESTLRLNHSLVRLLVAMMSGCVFAHIVACAFYFMTKLEGFTEDSWVVRGGYVDDDPSQIYMTSLYWTFTTISTVGFGDITPHTPLERFFAI